MRDEFLSEEDLDLQNLSEDELLAYWDLWLRQAQATNDLDADEYTHGACSCSFPRRRGTRDVVARRTFGGGGASWPLFARRV